MSRRFPSTAQASNVQKREGVGRATRSLYVVSAAEWRPPASHWLWSEPAYFVHLNLLS